MRFTLNSLKIILVLITLITINPSFSAAIEQPNRPASSFTVINYARNLLLSIVDGNFRGSWVIDPEKRDKIKLSNQEKSFDSLSNIKIGSSSRDVKKLLNTPQEIRSNGKLWIYGIPGSDGTYKDLLEVFFDEKDEHVIGVISFNKKNIIEKIGLNIGDSIDKMITIYGEPIDEKDFIEDPDNKDYLGLYYLYPRSGIGFLLGQDKTTKNLLVQGVLVFGKQ